MASRQLKLLLGYDWNSASNIKKRQYLMLVLQLSTAELASTPGLFAFSLESSEFIYHSKAITPDMPLGLSGQFSYVQVFSDAGFAARFNKVSASPP